MLITVNVFKYDSDLSVPCAGGDPLGMKPPSALHMCLCRRAADAQLDRPEQILKKRKKDIAE
jgi:hypothetical protein